jgi:hypothetical protein
VRGPGRERRLGRSRHSKQQQPGWKRCHENGRHEESGHVQGESESESECECASVRV